MTAFLSTYPVRGTTGEQEYKAAVSEIFLSTYPVRGTTKGVENMYSLEYISIHVPRAGYDADRQGTETLSTYFYPRTPCGVRPYTNVKAVYEAHISIHVPRAGYD